MDDPSRQPQPVTALAAVAGGLFDAVKGILRFLCYAAGTTLLIAGLIVTLVAVDSARTVAEKSLALGELQASLLAAILGAGLLLLAAVTGRKRNSR